MSKKAPSYPRPLITPEEYVKQLRREHFEVGSEVLGEGVRLCYKDGLSWPCPTARELARVEL